VLYCLDHPVYVQINLVRCHKPLNTFSRRFDMDFTNVAPNQQWQSLLLLLPPPADIRP
jgi:hypothetical protein